MPSPPTPAEIDALVREAAARAEPCARLLLAPRPGLRAPVAVLSGAFDPPTRAHAALARAALRRGMATLLFAIAVQTVDKERGTRAGVGLRLTLLCRYARRRPWLGVLVCNRGLYLEQAAALAELGVDAPVFVIGFDKLSQVFDPRYYADRDAALRRLFEAARFLVAPRDAAGQAEIDAFMARPEQRAYRAAVAPLPLSAAEARLTAGMASTRVRELAARGDPWLELLPVETRALAARSGVYGPAGA